MSKLTARERVNRMFARKPHDRVPRHEGFWPETIERWQSEGLDGDHEKVLQLLESDFHEVCWTWPAPFPNQREVLSEDETTQVVRDKWGGIARSWKHRSGTPEHIRFECDSRETWEKTYRPAFLAAGLPENVDTALRRFRRGRELDKWCYMASAEAFETLRKIVGDEVCLIAMIEDPEWVRDIARVHTDSVLKTFDALLAGGVEPDGIWMFGDMAYNHATMCSPQMYRDLIWPEHKRMADWAHERGMRFIYHTDGCVSGVLDLYLEAGFDAYHPIESKAGMDIRELCPKYGDKLAMVGNIDVMVMATNDLEKIETEITSKFAAGKASHGYVYHSDHSVPPTVSWETYQGIIELVNRHGSYM